MRTRAVRQKDEWQSWVPPSGWEMDRITRGSAIGHPQATEYVRLTEVMEAGWGHTTITTLSGAQGNWGSHEGAACSREETGRWLKEFQRSISKKREVQDLPKAARSVNNLQQAKTGLRRTLVIRWGPDGSPEAGRKETA